MNQNELEDALHPYDRLIEIDILGEKKLVPENNSILRAFQFLNPEEISEGEFCWNGDCINCQVWIKNGDKEKMVMACRADVKEGMEIVKVGQSIGELYEND